MGMNTGKAYSSFGSRFVLTKYRRDL